MRNNHILKRLLSVMLVLCIVAAWILPAPARAAGIRFTQVSNDRVSANLLGKDAVTFENEQEEYAATDVVRVSIFLEAAGVLDAGYSVRDLAQNESAMAYREKLDREQTSVIAKIEKAINEKLDVVWNLTLATNLISANVQYGQIAAIEKVAGVKSVRIEIQYQPDVVSSAPADPNMATSGLQTGTTASYAAGYSGAGSRVAIIDTGLDIDHLSFDASAFDYSLSLLAEKANLSTEEFVEGLELLDAEEIAAVLSQLNVLERARVSAEDMYFSTKIPFIFNYVDHNTNVTHLYDQQGEHGSHVAGIATANAYVPTADGTFANALKAVSVQGVAPDAQVMVMKVFGEAGGAYQADYMAAIEDAILLGADSINLSLGSPAPGYSADANEEYRAIFNSLEKCGVVVSISAGNAGAWMDAAENGAGYMYLDDVSMHTGGSPGSFINSLGVASVNNAGYVTTFVEINGQNVPYMERLYDSTTGAAYGNTPLTTLAGEREYVFLNGIGTPEQFAALGEGALKGKIAICYRGETSFFEKANAAVEAGAIGVLIVNNQEGIILLNLTGYLYNAPVVSVQQTDGEAFKVNPVTDDAGNVLCWTGTMNVAESQGAFLYPGDYTMSSFSSWGVPGSLVMKPEITAPGGEILSVNGANYAYGNYKHDQYELMSGTSMAAPQVAGMAALVAQYIRENNLEERTGLDARTLAQSLLMSTAVPLINGENKNYYPVLQQGAGMANVGAAVLADSYILMNENATASYADGKVKVELGDDADRAGVYTFSFTINNLTDTQKQYILSADFFTQDAFEHNGILYMDTLTRSLNPIVTFTVNGESIEGGAEMKDMDFNADGLVNNADGQLLLDYATEAATEIPNDAAADLNGDEFVTSYDAYLFFKMLGESGAVVAANGSATVEVTVELTESDRAWLENYENGAYLEGFVYAESLTSEEGVEGTTHSIPVLGFYGNWTDASMFDKGSYEEFVLSGEENRAPYLYQSAMGQGNANGLFVTYANEPDSEYYFGGNPIVTDAVYMPERNALSTINGDIISTIGFTSIRNAAASFYQIIDVTTGDVLVDQALGQVASAYYHVNQGSWKNTYWTLGTEMDPSMFLDETLLQVGLTLIPEYYVDEEGNVDWESLGNGATYSMNVMIDNTAPTISNVTVDEENNALNVNVTDNQYVAAVALLDQNGTYVFALEGAQLDAAAGEACQYSLDLTGVAGTGFLLQVYDYAMNCTTYEINEQIGEMVDDVDSITLSETSMILQKGSTVALTAVVYPVNATNREVVWSSTNEAVATVDENGNVLAVGKGTAQIVATAVADVTVTATCSVEVIDIAVDLNAVIWDEEGAIWYSSFNTSNLLEYEKLSGDLYDVDTLATACVGPDGTIYASSLNTNTGTGSLYTIDPVTYEATKLNDCLVQGLNIFYSDIAYAPNMYGTGVDALLVTYGPYLISLDPATGEYIEIIDEYDEYLIGIAVCYGAYSEEYEQSNISVYVMDRAGKLYQDVYCYLPSFGYTLPYYFYTTGSRVYLNTGIGVGSAWYFNSLHYDAENAMVYWSAFDVETMNEVTLYAIDEMNDFEIYNMGQFAEGVWPIAGLHQSAAAAADANAFVNVTAVTARETIELQKVNNDVVLPMSYVTEGEEENTIVVKLTAKDLEGNNVDSTNGIITVTFNSAAMTLTNVLVNGDYISINETDGFVTFGYVKMDGFEANDVVATLVFEVLDETDSGVTVIYDEVNDAKHGFSEDLGLGDVLLGDVNGDGKIDTIDAKMVMQYDLGLLSEDNLNLAVADVNGDGKVNTTDAKLIMQYDLDLIEKFPAED